MKAKKEGPRAMQGGWPRVQGKGREHRLKGGPRALKKRRPSPTKNEAEPKGRGGPRALGFQTNLYNHKKNEFFNAKYPQNQSMQTNEEQRVV